MTNFDNNDGARFVRLSRDVPWWAPDPAGHVRTADRHVTSLESGVELMLDDCYP